MAKGIMRKYSALKVLAVAGVVVLGAQGASAETVLKLGTVGRPGMPIGDAIEQALIPKAAEVSGGKLTVEPHYRGSLCGEQKCGEQANQGLLQLWTSSTANFGNFGTALSIFDLPYLFKSLDAADQVAAGWLSDAQCKVAAETTGHICFVVYASGGFRHLGNALRPVHVPDEDITEWYEPNDAEMALWRAGAVGAWKNARGTYDPKLAERALAEQGLDDFIATLKQADAL